MTICMRGGYETIIGKPLPPTAAAVAVVLVRYMHIYVRIGMSIAIHTFMYVCMSVCTIICSFGNTCACA